MNQQMERSIFKIYYSPCPARAAYEDFHNGNCSQEKGPGSIQSEKELFTEKSTTSDMSYDLPTWYSFKNLWRN